MNQNNKVYLKGTLFNVPEIATTSKGNTYANFILAVKRNKGDWKDNISCVAWNDKADILKNAKQGDNLEVNGSIQIDSYTKDNKKVYVTKISADDVTIVNGD